MLDRLHDGDYNHFMIEKWLRIGSLLDFYGPLLTEKQRLCLELHYQNDWSLGEIAAHLAISRQAVNDMLKRTEETLSDYEVKLGLLEKYERQQIIVQEVCCTLAELASNNCKDHELIQRAKAKLQELFLEDKEN